MIRAGSSDKIDLKISGHRTRSVLDRYDIVYDRDLVEAPANLENYLGKNSCTVLSKSGTAEPEASSEQKTNLIWVERRNLVGPVGLEPTTNGL